MLRYYLNAIIILISCRHKNKSKLLTIQKINLVIIPSLNQPSDLKENGLLSVKSINNSKDKKYSLEQEYIMLEEKVIIASSSSDKISILFKPVLSNHKPHLNK